MKEADALTQAGYDVKVVACKYQEWADEADASFSDRDWSIHWVHYGRMASRPRDLWQRVRRRASKELVGIMGTQSGLTERAFHYAIPELTRRVQQISADLYIAHNLAALPVADRAAQAHNAALGFDAEDFHRGELPDTPENALERRITSDLEERYIPRCDYVTAASEGIGNAYADTLNVEPPTTILNVFPWSEREQDVPKTALDSEVPNGKRSLYWFSQTIGPDRGLEDALRALPSLPDDVILSLRGQWSPGYEDAFRRQAERLGVADRIWHLDLVPPDELISRTAQHDVGLALEPGFSENNKIAISNKLFTYLLSGVPIVATDTPGQRPVAEDLSEVARLYAPGAIEAFSECVAELLASSGLSERALQVARDRYCWEEEQSEFLSVVEDVLGTTAGNDRQGSRENAPKSTESRTESNRVS
ncbi:glycosyltransferase involved in cell wall biosynthesis [Salinibacter ruber]|nr:glycosyltransferase involved in cell wall biosynthesis [Salinibacter ruber]